MYFRSFIAVAFIFSELERGGGFRTPPLVQKVEEKPVLDRVKVTLYIFNSLEPLSFNGVTRLLLFLVNSVLKSLLKMFLSNEVYRGERTKSLTSLT